MKKESHTSSLQNQYSELMQMIHKSYQSSEIERYCAMARNVESDVNTSNIHYSNSTTYGN